ncbi:hypothetical protein C8R46DRAFT_1107313 [Mycena filopes]|nr:hypothetical protein C8R46DRAFT_1107313 [Mycena filopes]
MASQTPWPLLSSDWSIATNEFTPPTFLPCFDPSLSADNSITNLRSSSRINVDVAHPCDGSPYLNFDQASMSHYFPWPASGATTDRDDARRFHEAASAQARADFNHADHPSQFNSHEPNCSDGPSFQASVSDGPDDGDVGSTSSEFIVSFPNNAKFIAYTPPSVAAGFRFSLPLRTFSPHYFRPSR